MLIKQIMLIKQNLQKTSITACVAVANITCIISLQVMSYKLRKKVYELTLIHLLLKFNSWVTHLTPELHIYFLAICKEVHEF